jgi:hypothetical protein
MMMNLEAKKKRILASAVGLTMQSELDLEQDLKAAKTNAELDRIQDTLDSSQAAAEEASYLDYLQD